MQITKMLFALPIVVVLFLILLGAFQEVYMAAHEVRTENVQDSGLSCATAAGETSCAITLSSAHAFSDLSGASITETSPGNMDRTASSSLQADRQTVDVTGLDSLESYQFTADYAAVAEDLGAGTGELLAFWPWVFTLGGGVLFVVGLVAGLRRF